MLALDLLRLEREKRPLGLRVDLPPDYPPFADAEFRFHGPIEVDLRAVSLAGGEVRVFGVLTGRCLEECRRCLDAVKVDVEQEIELLYAAEEEIGSEEGERGVRPIAVGITAIDLSAAIREELILSSPRYPVCDPECPGLCSRCGAHGGEERCDCMEEELDPRWGALRVLIQE